MLSRLVDRVFQLEEINGGGVCPTYLYRWTLLRVGSLFSIYLHKFVGDDWSRDLHDHPKRFISIGLRGSYFEQTPDPDSFTGCRARIWVAPWIRTFPATHIHRLWGPTPEEPCWTLVIVGRPVRPWGFWSRLGEFVPWRKYVGSDEAKARRSCP